MYPCKEREVNPGEHALVRTGLRIRVPRSTHGTFTTCVNVLRRGSEVGEGVIPPHFEGEKSEDPGGKLWYENPYDHSEDIGCSLARASTCEGGDQGRMPSGFWISCGPFASLCAGSTAQHW